MSGLRSGHYPLALFPCSYPEVGGGWEARVLMKKDTCVKAETTGRWGGEKQGMQEGGRWQRRGACAKVDTGKWLGSGGMCKWARAFATAESTLGLAYLPDRSPLA
jgi:hypothetical protein